MLSWELPKEEEQEVAEQVQPQKGYFSQVFDNIGTWGKAAYADTRQIGLDTKIKDTFDAINNHQYRNYEEYMALRNQLWNLVDEQEQYQNDFAKNQKILDENKSELADLTQIGGTAHGIGTQFKDTLIGGVTGALAYGLPAAAASGGVAALPAAMVGAVKGATWANRYGALDQAYQDARLNAIDAWKTVLREGGNAEQAEQAYKDALVNNLPTEALDAASSMYMGSKILGKAIGSDFAKRVSKSAIGNAAQKVSKFDLPSRIATAVADKTGKSWVGKGVGFGLATLENAGEEGVQEPWQDYATARAVDIQRRQYDPTHEGIRDFSVFGDGGLLDYYTTPEGKETAWKAAKMGAVFGSVGGVLTASEHTKLGTAHSDSIRAGEQIAKEFSEGGDLANKLNADKKEEMRGVVGNLYDLSEGDTANLSDKEVYRMWHDYWTNKLSTGGLFTSGNRQEVSAAVQADMINALTDEETNRMGLMNDSAKKYIDKYGMNPDGSILQHVNEQVQQQTQQQVEQAAQQTEQQDTQEGVGIYAKGTDKTFGNTQTNEEQTSSEQPKRGYWDLPEQFDNAKQWERIDEGNDQLDYNEEAYYKNNITGRVAHILRIRGGKGYEYVVTDVTDKDNKGQARGQFKKIKFDSIQNVGKYLNTPHANKADTAFMADSQNGNELAGIKQQLPKEDGVISEKNTTDDGKIWKDVNGNQWLNGKLIQSNKAVKVHTLLDLNKYYRENSDLMDADLYAEVARNMMRFGIGKSNNTSIVLDLSNEWSGARGSKTTTRDANGAIADAVVRLYAGADLVTAAHEVAHLGWINLSDQDKETFGNWAIDTEEKFVAQVLGIQYDDNFKAYLLEALTNQGVGGSRDSQVLWAKIQMQGATRQTIDILNNHRNAQNMADAIDERFAWEFSNWFAQGYIRGSEPRNVIERILQKACMSMGKALNLLADTKRYLDGDQSREVNRIFTNMSATKKDYGQVRTAPQMQTTEPVSIRTEMTQPVQNAPYNMGQGFVEQTETENYLDSPSQTQNLGRNTGTIGAATYQQPQPTQASPEQDLSKNAGTMPVNLANEPDEVVKNKPVNYQDVQNPQETIDQYRERTQKEQEEDDKIQKTKVAGYKEYKDSTIKSLVKGALENKKGFRENLMKIRQNVNPARLESIIDEVVAERKKKQEKNMKKISKTKFTNQNMEAHPLGVGQTSLRKNELKANPLPLGSQGSYSMPRLATPMNQEVLDKMNEAYKAGTTAPQQQSLFGEEETRENTEQVQKPNTVEQPSLFTESDTENVTTNVTKETTQTEKTAESDKNIQQETQRESNGEETIEQKIEREKEYYGKKEFEYNGQKYKYDPEEYEFYKTVDGKRIKISDTSVDGLVLEGMRRIDSPFFKKGNATLESAINHLESEKIGAENTLKNTTKKELKNDKQLQEWTKEKNELQKKIKDAQKTINGLKGSYDTRSLESTMEEMKRELDQIEGKIAEYLRDIKEWREWKQEVKQNVPKAIKILKAMYGQKKQTSPTVKKTKTQTQETTQQTQEEPKEQVQKEETMGNNNKEWFEDMKPYFNGKNTSERVLSKTGDYRIVKRGYKVVDENGNPYGKVKYSYDVDQLGMEIDGEYGLESSFPTNDEAKKYLAEKVNSNTESNKSETQTPVQSSTVEQQVSTKSEPVVAKNETTEKEETQKEQEELIGKEKEINKKLDDVKDTKFQENSTPLEKTKALQELANKINNNLIEFNVASYDDPKAREFMDNELRTYGWTFDEIKLLHNRIRYAKDTINKIREQSQLLDDWESKGVVTDEKNFVKTVRKVQQVIQKTVPVDNPFISNGDYTLNTDFGTMCMKKEAMDAAVQIIIDMGLGQNLGSSEMELIKDILIKYKMITPCDMCFVEAKRVRVLSDANKSAFDWKSVLIAAKIYTEDKDGNMKFLPLGTDRSKGSGNELTEEQIKRLKVMADKSKKNGQPYKKAFEKWIPEDRRRHKDSSDNDLDTGTTADKMAKIAKLILEDHSLAGELNPLDLVSTRGIDKLFLGYGGHTGIVPTFSGMYGSATSKPIQSFRMFDPRAWIYISEEYSDNKIKKSLGIKGKVGSKEWLKNAREGIIDKDRITESVYDFGGMRLQSFSDYNPVLFFDYCQFIADCEGRYLPMHTYTKVPYLVELFNQTRMMMNMSFIPEVVVDLKHDELDENGKLKHAGLKYNPETGEFDLYAWHKDSFPIELGYEYRKKYDYAGTIAVGISDAHIRKMMADPEIDMIIPYHKSGMPLNVQIKTGLVYAKSYEYAQTIGIDDEAKKKFAKDHYSNYEKKMQGTPDQIKRFLNSVGERMAKVDLNYSRLLFQEGDPHKAAQKYLDLCKKYGCTPVFEEFAYKNGDKEACIANKGYYKMLEDFRGYDTKGNAILQKPVQLKFPEGFEKVLEKSILDRTKMKEHMNKMLKNEDFLKDLKKALEPQRIDGEVRTQMMKRLRSALGQNNVITLAKKEFFDELEKYYQSGLTEEEAKAKVEVFRQMNGTVYGFARNNKIYLNENVFNAGTPAHEFTHVWARVAQNMNPDLWKEGVRILKEERPDLWHEVETSSLYGSIADNDDAIASEVLARLVAQENVDFIKQQLEPSKTMGRGTGLIERIKIWCMEMFDSVRSIFDSIDGKPLTFDEFVKMPLKALWDTETNTEFRSKTKEVIDSYNTPISKEQTYSDLQTNKSDTKMQLHSEEGLEKTDINTPAFKNWFKGSIMTNDDGTPKVFYRGMRQHYDPSFDKEEGGAIWVSVDKDVAEQYRDSYYETAELLYGKNKGKEITTLVTGRKGLNEQTGDLAEVYVNLKKPFDIGQVDFDGSDHDVYIYVAKSLKRDADKGIITKDQMENAIRSLEYLNKKNKSGNYPPKRKRLWERFANKKFFKAIKEAGYDGVKGYEFDDLTYGVFDKGNVKSIYNQGTWDKSNPDTRMQEESYNEKYDKQVHSQQFKNWFGDWENDPKNASKVVDKDGKPLVVYHGTPSGGFSVFNTGVANGKKSQWQLLFGSHWTEKREVAEGYTTGKAGARKKVTNPQVYECYLNIRNPLDLTNPYTDVVGIYTTERMKNNTNKEMFGKIAKVLTKQEIKKFLKKNSDGQYFVIEHILQGVATERAEQIVRELGYDGVIYNANYVGGGRVQLGQTTYTTDKSYIVLDPNQIKSVDNNGNFDPNNPDIKMQGESIERPLNQQRAITILDGKLKGGKTLNFVNAILDHKKKGETRTTKTLTRNEDLGITNDKQNVVGVIRLGDPRPLQKYDENGNKTQDYIDSMIEGTDYDIDDNNLAKNGKPKYFYPITVVKDLRKNPAKVTRNVSQAYKEYDASNSKFNPNSSDTKMQGNSDETYLDKEKDIYSVTFTKSAQKVAENQKKMKHYRDNASYWRENPNKDGSITFVRALPYKHHTRTIIYDDIDGKKVGKRPKAKALEYLEAFKDQIVKWFFNDKHFLYKAAKKIGALDSYMRMMVMKDQGAVAGAAIEDGIVKHNGKNGERTKSLNSIIEAVGEENQIEFLKYCEAFRVLDLYDRKILQKMTSEDDTLAKQIIADVKNGKNAKLFEEQRKNFVEYNHELLWVLVDGGFITEETYNKLIKNDPNFVPLAKNMDELEGYVDSFGNSKSMININNPLHKIKTSFREVKNPFLEMQKRTVEYYVKASRNKAGMIFVNDIAKAIAKSANGDIVAMNQGMVRKLKSRDRNGVPIRADSLQNVFYIWNNGEKEYYQVADREIYAALKSFDSEQMSALKKIVDQTAGRASRLVRDTATMTPDFGLRNLCRDTVEAFISSQHGFIPIIDSLWGMYQMANDTQWYREYQRMNGEPLNTLNRGGGDEDVATVEHGVKDNIKMWKTYRPLIKKDYREFMDKDRSKTARAKSLLLLTTDVIGLHSLYKANKRLNDYLETGTRIGEYRNARMGYHGLSGRLFGSKVKGSRIFTTDRDLIHATHDEMFAAYKSKDVTLNFGQHGSLGKELNHYIPFFNASLQGIYKICNTIGEMVYGEDTRIKQELWFKCILFGAMGMAAALAGADDDDYTEAPEWEHDNFWILPSGIRIAKDQLFGRMIAGTVEKATRQYLRDGDVKKLDLLFDVLGNFAIDKCTPALADMWLGTWGNYDTFRKQAVVPEYMERKGMYGYLKKDLSTSKIAADISEALLDTIGVDIAAKKVDFFLQKTLSNTGNYVRNLYELGTNPNERMTRGAEPEDKGGFAEWSKELPYPMNTIVGTFATNRNSFQSISDFYTRYKELQTKSSAPERMSKAEGRAWKAYEAAYKQDRSYRNALKAIKQDKSLTGAQKRERADKIFKQQIRMARKLRDYERRQGLI